LMGVGIVEVAARSGYEVVVREINDELLAKGMERLRGSLQRAVERGKLDEAGRDAALSRIQGTTVLADLAGVELVVEAILEQMDDKKALLREMDRLVAPGVVLASNTSSLSITEMAAATGRADRVVGLHFFNPVPVMPLVEIVKGLRTSEEVVQEMRGFAQSLGKTVVVARDTPGFIVNRLLIPYLLDAIRALELGVASREDIDSAITLGLGHPMGPLTLLDFVGLDTTYYIAEAMFAEFKDTRYAPPPLLRQMVLAGWLGRKSKRGFYEYQ